MSGDAWDTWNRGWMHPLCRWKAFQASDTSRSSHRGKGERAVVPAEAETIRKYFADASHAGLVRDVIEVAARLAILVLEVDGWGQHAVLEAEAAGNGLDAAAGPEQ